MKISQEVREYADKNDLNDSDALQRGLDEKAKEFKSAGAEIYVKQ